MKEGTYDHGRYAVAITYTANVYEALLDSKGNALPFFINAPSAGVINVKLEDSDVFVDVNFTDGTNTEKVIAVSDSGALSAGLVAEYPYKPAATTINTTE
jgi:hypothetical protein